MIKLEAWNEGFSMNNNNISTIFKSSVIWYTSFPEIQSIWILYNYGGASPKLIDIQHWITYQEVVQTKTLQLTTPIY